MLAPRRHRHGHPRPYAARPGTTSTDFELQDNVAGAPAAGAQDQFLELDSDGPSRISQSIATSPGSTYRLTYLWSPRRGAAAAENTFQVSAGAESAVIGPLAGGAQTAWRTETLDFETTAATSEIAFLDLGPEQ